MRRIIFYFSCYCCCWMQWEIFPFEMLPWISVSTVKLIESKHCSIHTRERACTVGALSKQTVSAVTHFRVHADVRTWVRADPRGHEWMTISTLHIPERTPADTESMNWPSGWAMLLPALSSGSCLKMCVQWWHAGSRFVCRPYGYPLGEFGSYHLTY